MFIENCERFPGEMICEECWSVIMEKITSDGSIMKKVIVIMLRFNKLQGRECFTSYGRRNGHPRQSPSVPIFTDIFWLISLSISSPFQLFILSFFQATHYSLWYINTMKHYSAIERSEIWSFTVMWMDLGSVTQSEIRQKKRKTNIVWYHIHMEYRKRVQMNLFSGQE